MTEADIVIVGGGMVGASLAVALARACPDQKIAVLEAVNMPDPGPEPVFQPSYDARSTALSYGTRRIYERLGLWEQLAEHVTPIERIHVSDRGQFGATRLHAHDHQLEALGYVVENQWMGRVLWAGLRQYPNIEFLCPVRVGAIRQQAQGVQVEYLNDAGETTVMGAQLAVLADGGRSGLRQQLGIQLEAREYAQSAVVANVSPRQHHQFVAYERFTEYGPMALLPLGERNADDHRCVLVWTLPSHEAEQLVAAPEQEFLDVLTERFGRRLGGFVQVGRRQTYPLVLERALEQIRPGLVLVGNAAHTLHPVAGQGYNLALREVMGLAQHLAGAHSRGRWLGDLAVLREFEAEQASDLDRTIHFSDQLVKVFSNRRFPLVPVRGLGLVTLDLLPPLKQSFARYAMGMGGREAAFG